MGNSRLVNLSHFTQELSLFFPTLTLDDTLPLLLNHLWSDQWFKPNEYVSHFIYIPRLSFVNLLNGSLLILGLILEPLQGFLYLLHLLVPSLHELQFISLELDFYSQALELMDLTSLIPIWCNPIAQTNHPTKRSKLHWNLKNYINIDLWITTTPTNRKP